MDFYTLTLLLALSVTQILAESKALDGIVNSEISFAKSYSQSVYKYNDKEDIVCSPLSSYLLLAQASYGADGNTAKELNTALSLPEDENLSLDGFQSLRAKLETANNVTLNIANKLYVYKNTEINETYVNLLENIFDSDITSFTGSAVELANDINGWVDNKTNHKINNLIKSDDIDEELTKLILLNAVYFNAEWLQPFSARYTDLRTFTDLDNKKHNVTMMTQHSRKIVYGQLKNINAKYIELPYKNSDFKMIIVVHDKESINATEFNELGEELQKYSYKELPKEGDESSVTITIPKFKIESLIDLQPVLEAMEVKEMFTDKANFKKIVKNQNDDLQITKILQKVFIDVNEVGTEATAASFVEFEGRMISDHITVNVPFYFLIESNYGVLFQGRVLLPHYKQ